MDERKVYTLLQVSEAVKRRIEEAAAGGWYWVRAEIAGLRTPNHAYLELVEHRQGRKVAVMRGVIWADALARIRETLGAEAANILKEGAEVLVRARLNYHHVFGISLHIEDVDLGFSLGELERRKRATIEQLKTEGLYDLNRAVPEPPVMQRIALVTSEGSAAYADFMQHLLNNEYGYRFHVRLYPTLVQGDQAAPALRMAVAAIDPDRFDAVVLIRGGGGRLDLEPFNDLELCRLLARLPIPVLTGIGHDVDVSVADLIAHGAHKTPTAVADHLIDRCAFFESGLNGFLVGIQQRMQELFAGNRERLATHAADLRERPVNICRKRQGELQAAAGQFGRLSTAVLQQRAQHMATLRATLAAEALRGVRLLLRGMEGMQEAVRLLAPDQVLQRGYSITRADGAAVRNAADLRPGDELETQFATGRAWSTIQRIDPHG